MTAATASRPKVHSPASRPRGNALRATAEHELLLHVVGTHARRLSRVERIVELLGEIDSARLIDAAARQRILPLLASRLRELVGDLVPPRIETAAAQELAENRRRATLFMAVTHRLLDSLEQAGVRAVPLKGPIFARRVFGDEGFRGSTDIDLLVAPDDFRRASATIAEQGYVAETAAPWIAKLPLFEASLIPLQPWLPPVDLHWRLEWYSEDYSALALRRSLPDADGRQQLAPVDELAAMLIYYLRDGFWGLRLPADLSAWWDSFGSAVEPRALDGVVEASPALKAPLTASAVALERLIGLPADDVITVDPSVRTRYRWAGRRANWTANGGEWDLYRGVLVADAVVSLGDGFRAFLGRHWLLPRPVLAEMYELPRDARMRLFLRSFWYASVLVKNLAKSAWAHRMRMSAV